MLHVAFGQVIKKADYPFRTFKDSRIMSWEPEGCNHWVVVLKESVREVENYESLPMYYISTIGIQYHEDVTFTLYAEAPEIPWKPNWLLFDE
jgi:hypothetical protein